MLLTTMHLCGEQQPNNSFKPNLLRGGSGRYSLRQRPSPVTSQVGLTQALGHRGRNDATCRSSFVYRCARTCR